jgi:hypothetical protein
MFGRDEGFEVPVVATDGTVGIEKRVEVFVGESNSADEEERTEKRDGGCADMSVECVKPEIGSDVAERATSRFALFSSPEPSILQVKRSVNDLLALLLLPDAFPSCLSRPTTRRVPSSCL